MKLSMQPPRFFLAIIGDVVQSRQISRRAKFQELFHKTMQDFNQSFQPTIISPFTVTLGDEFQAILKDAAPIFRIRELLQEKLTPQRIVLGIGVGSIETQINPISSIGMDGPALRLARQCVEKAKKSPPALRIAVEGFQSDILNCLVHFIELAEEKHTPIQRQVIQLYRQLGNQKQVAQQLGVSQPSVSQVLKAARFYLLQQSQQAIVDFLNQFL